MIETQTGYRAFPPEIHHPSAATFLTQEQFDKIEKQQMEQAPPACPGHAGTVVWYEQDVGYIIQVQMDGKPDVFARSICTITPTFGMDQIDGTFAQDIEEYILQQHLSHSTDRFDVFQDKPSISTEDYLRSRGIIE